MPALSLSMAQYLAWVCSTQLRPRSGPSSSEEQILLARPEPPIPVLPVPINSVCQRNRHACGHSSTRSCICRHSSAYSSFGTKCCQNRPITQTDLVVGSVVTNIPMKPDPLRPISRILCIVSPRCAAQYSPAAASSFYPVPWSQSQKSAHCEIQDSPTSARPYLSAQARNGSRRTHSRYSSLLLLSCLRASSRLPVDAACNRAIPAKT